MPVWGAPPDTERAERRTEVGVEVPRVEAPGEPTDFVAPVEFQDPSASLAVETVHPFEVPLAVLLKEKAEPVAVC